MRVTDLTLEVRNRGLDRVGQITPHYLSFQARERWCGVGEWSLNLPGDHPMVPELSQPGSGILLLGPTESGTGTLLSGPTTLPKRVRNAQNPDGTFTFSGVTDEVVLQGASAFPDPAIGTAQESSRSRANDTRSGTTEGLLRAYVEANLVPGVAPSARVRGLRQYLRLGGVDQGRGLPQQKSPRFQRLIELLQEIVAYDPDYGFRVVQVGAHLEFQVVPARDRSPFVRFDIDNGTITSEEVSSSGPNVTDAIVAGGGEGVERIIVQRRDEEAAAAEEAYGIVWEEFIDQRQTEDSTELMQAGDERLFEGRGGTAVKLIPSSDTTMQVGVDWRAGDVVTAVVGEEEPVARVTEVVWIVDPAGVQAGAALGDVSRLRVEDAQAVQVRSIESRVAQLERSGVGGGGGKVPPLPNPVKAYGAQANTITASAWGTAVPGTTVTVDAAGPLRVLVIAGAWVGNTGGITRAGVSASGATTLSPPDPGWGMVLMSPETEGSEQRAMSAVVDLAEGTTTFRLEAWRTGTQAFVNYPVLQVIPLSWIGSPGSESVAPGSVSWGDVQGKPAQFPPTEHGHAWDDITGKPSTFPSDGHSHEWAVITGKPSTFAPSAHSHAWSEVTGKPTTFPPSSHTHTVAQVEFTVGERDATSGQETYPTGVSIHQTTGEGWPSATATVTTFNHGPHRCVQMVFDKETPKVWERTSTGPTTWTAWTDLYVPAATTSVVGKSRMATDAEVQAGTSDSVSVTPGGLASLTASNSRRGLAAIASQAEVLAGTETGKFVTPATLSGRTAQNDRSGLVTLASAAEVQDLTDTGKAITPAALATLTAQNDRTGLVALASAAEVQAGTVAGKAVTPAALATLTAQNARRGLVFLATAAEAQAGADTGKAVTPAALASTLDARSASNSTRGLVFLASAAEVAAGTDTGKAVTPAGLSSALDARSASNSERGLVFLASAAETQAGTDTGKAVTPAALASVTASNSRRGLVLLASAAEVQAGTDTGKAVTAAGLASLTAQNSRRGLAAIASQAEVDAGTDAAKFISPLALRGAKGIVRGDNDHKYRMVGGVIRNTGSGFQWIDDTAHAPMGFSGAPVTLEYSVELPYAFTAAKVISFSATPDDGFAALGYQFGASVGLDKAIIAAGIVDGFHDYVRWSGTAWVSSTGFITSTVMNSSTGIITFNHEDVGAAYQFGGSITMRTAGANRISQESQGATSMSVTVYPYNSATSVKAPTTDMRFWITRPGVRRVKMAELVQSGTNIWVQGLMEVA